MPSPHPLRTSFALQPTANLVSFVGGGGKTSLLFALSRELAAAGQRVIATTTTRIATGEVLRAPAYCLAAELYRLPGLLEEHPFCVVVGAVGHDKAKSVPLSLPGRLLARPGIDHVLVEADGAKMLPIKAPGSHEPAIPPGTTLLVPVVGIDALSATLQAIAHRPELLGTLLNRSLHEKLTPQDVARLLTSEDGALRNAPAHARIIPFINKVESDEQMAEATEIARLVIAHPRIERVLIGAARTDRPVRHIVAR